MWPDRVLNPEPLTYESGVLPTALRGQAILPCKRLPVIKKTKKAMFEQNERSISDSYTVLYIL